MANPILPSDLKEKMNGVGQILKEQFKPYGFTLLVFDYGPSGRMNYISSACREDMIASLKELVALLEGRVVEGMEIKQ